MKLKITTIGVCALLTGATQLIAQEAKQPQVKGVEIKTAKATVEKVDKDKREVTLKSEDGTEATIKVPETVRNFDQIKVGDIVTAKYTESVALAVRKADEPPSATGRETTTRAPLGERPSGQRTATLQISATIEKIDRDKRELTLKGPQGNTRVVKVPEDLKRFDDLKEGDQVVVTSTESLAIDVSSPEK